jgi:transcriptional regulator with XRE-family HTH domain
MLGCGVAQCGPLARPEGVVSVIGKLIRDRRRARHLSQTQLGELVGLTQRYISRIERGEIGLPQRATRDKFGGVLGIGEGEFLLAAGEFAADVALNGHADGSDEGLEPAPPGFDAWWRAQPRVGSEPEEVLREVGEVHYRRYLAIHYALNKNRFHAEVGDAPATQRSS